MNQELGKITSFTQLEAWKERHLLVLDVYRITKTFLKDKLFGLTSQMRRCVVSITPAIVEGFSRNSYKEKIQFYSIGLGSTTELQNQLLVARDVGFIKPSNFQRIAKKNIFGNKLLNGLIKKIKIKNS